MHLSQIYIAIGIISLAIIYSLVLLRNKGSKNKKLSPLASIAFGFVLVGLLFRGNRFIGYSLITIGVILSVIDIIKYKAKR